MYKRLPLEKRLKLRGSVWWFWGYDYSGKRYRTTTHQTERKAALEVARKIEREQSVPSSDPTGHKKQTFTLAQALDLLEKHDVRANAAENTIRFHEDRGRHLVRLLGANTTLVAITLPLLNDYTDKRLAENADRHTVQKEHRVLRQVLGLAKANSTYDGDPKKLTVEGFEKPSGNRGFYKPGATWLESVEHIAALIEHTSSNPDRHRVDRRDDILVYVNLGLRRREVLVICPEHVDLRKRLLYVRELSKDGEVERRLKTDLSTRVLPLNDVMVELFTRRVRNARAGVPLFTDWGSGNRDLKANWQRARTSLLSRAKSSGQRADLDTTLPKSLTFNDMRRTFCSQMKNAGVSLEDCAELLGHSDLAMVKLVYGHTSIDTLRAAVARLPAMTLPPEALPRPEKLSRRQRQRLRQGAKARAAEGIASEGESAVSVCVTNAMRETASNGAG